MKQEGGGASAAIIPIALDLHAILIGLGDILSSFFADLRVSAPVLMSWWVFLAVWGRRFIHAGRRFIHMGCRRRKFRNLSTPLGSNWASFWVPIAAKIDKKQ